MAVKKYPPYIQNFIQNTKNAFIGKGASPDSIVIRDLNDGKKFNTDFTKLNSIQTNDLSPETMKIFGQLMSIYNNHITTKRQLLNQARTLFDSDIVQTIIDVIIDDAFNSFIDEQNEFKIEYRLDPEELEELGEEFQESVQNQIDSLVQKFDLKARIADIIPELLRDGEYAYGAIFEKGKGITDLIDDLDVIDLLPFYVGEKLSFIIKESSLSQNNGSATSSIQKEAPVIYNPENIIYFRLKYFAKERINLQPDNMKVNENFRSNFFQETGIYLPRFIRICRPIYYAAMKNIGQLQIIENINTVQELSQVLKPEIVNIQVPSNTSPIEAKNIIRDYERRLNEFTNSLDMNDLDVSTLAVAANRKIVFPQWLDGKGATSTSDLNSMGDAKANNIRESISFLRSLIAVSIGIPPFYININDAPIEKAQMAKMYSRYTRKLTSLQKTLAEGIIDIILLHLKNKDIFVDRKNISVGFKTLTSADSLDDTDMMVSTITAMNDLYKGLDEIASSPNNEMEINSARYKEVFDNYTRKYMGISDLLSYNEFKSEEGGGEFDNENDMEEFEPDLEIESEPSKETPDENAYDEFANAPENNSQITSNQNIETEI